MAFYGCDFTFNGVSASSMGLMLYNFGSEGQDDVDLSVGEIEADQINGRYTSLLYGLVQNEPLEFSLVFGADTDNIESGTFLTRERVNTITKWLTGYQSWKILTIDQPDMVPFHYKCMITGLKLITDGSYPWAFSARVTCDGPFAYRTATTTTQTLSGTAKTFTINNTSGLNGYYYPVITVTGNTGANLTIVNNTDGGRSCILSGMPTGSQNITINCENGVLTSSAGYNLYQYFNFNFLRLVPGSNSITATGNGTLTIQCEFPVNIGA